MCQMTDNKVYIRFKIIFIFFKKRINVQLASILCCLFYFFFFTKSSIHW